MLCREGNILFSIVRDAISKVPAKISKNNKASIFVWYDNLREGDFYSTLLPWQVVNRIPESNLMCRKAPFIRLMQRMQMFRPKQYQFVPKSYVLPLENEAFVKAVSKHDRMHIVKPDGGSLGIGIKVLQKDDDFTPDNHLAIAQEYVESYKIDDTKFDLRVYVLVSSLDPLRIYVYRDGVARFCSQKSTANTVYSQLTNTAVNKHNPDVKVESITKTIKQVFDVLKKDGVDTATIWKKIDRAIVLTVISALKYMREAEKEKCPQIGYPRCFQIFGFDVLLDTKLDPVIMEVNYRPSLAADTSDEKKMKIAMLSEAVKIAVPREVQPLLNDKTVGYVDSEWKKFFLEKENVVKAVKAGLIDKKKLVNFHQVYPSRGEAQTMYDEMIKFVCTLPSFVNTKYRLPCLLKDPKKKPVKNDPVVLSPDSTPTKPTQTTQTAAKQSTTATSQTKVTTKDSSEQVKKVPPKAPASVKPKPVPQQNPSGDTTSQKPLPEKDSRPQNGSSQPKQPQKTEVRQQPSTSQNKAADVNKGKVTGNTVASVQSGEQSGQQKVQNIATAKSKNPQGTAQIRAQSSGSKDIQLQGQNKSALPAVTQKTVEPKPKQMPPAPTPVPPLTGENKDVKGATKPAVPASSATSKPKNPQPVQVPALSDQNKAAKPAIGPVEKKGISPQQTKSQEDVQVSVSLTSSTQDKMEPQNKAEPSSCSPQNDTSTQQKENIQAPALPNECNDLNLEKQQEETASSASVGKKDADAQKNRLAFQVPEVPTLSSECKALKQPNGQERIASSARVEKKTVGAQQTKNPQSIQVPEAPTLSSECKDLKQPKGPERTASSARVEKRDAGTQQTKSSQPQVVQAPPVPTLSSECKDMKEPRRQERTASSARVEKRDAATQQTKNPQLVQVPSVPTLSNECKDLKQPKGQERMASSARVEKKDAGTQQTKNPQSVQVSPVPSMLSASQDIQKCTPQAQSNPAPQKVSIEPTVTVKPTESQRPKTTQGSRVTVILDNRTDIRGTRQTQQPSPTFEQTYSHTTSSKSTIRIEPAHANKPPEPVRTHDYPSRNIRTADTSRRRNSQSSQKLEQRPISSHSRERLLSSSGRHSPLPYQKPKTRDPIKPSQHLDMKQYLSRTLNGTIIPTNTHDQRSVPSQRSQSKRPMTTESKSPTSNNHRATDYHKISASSSHSQAMANLQTRQRTAEQRDRRYNNPWSRC